MGLKKRANIYNIGGQQNSTTNIHEKGNSIEKGRSPLCNRQLMTLKTNEILFSSGTFTSSYFSKIPSKTLESHLLKFPRRLSGCPDIASETLSTGFNSLQSYDTK